MVDSDLIQAIREKRQRLDGLRQEVATLEAELKAIGAVAQGRPPQAKLPLRRTRRAKIGSIQPGSSTDWARRVLKEAGRPMSVELILHAIEQAGGPEFPKPTIVSNLSRYFNRQDTFCRPNPNVYGLIEFEEGTETATGLTPKG